MLSHQKYLYPRLGFRCGTAYYFVWKKCPDSFSRGGSIKFSSVLRERHLISWAGTPRYVPRYLHVFGWHGVSNTPRAVLVESMAAIKCSSDAPHQLSYCTESGGPDSPVTSRSLHQRLLYGFLFISIYTTHVWELELTSHIFRAHEILSPWGPIRRPMWHVPMY